ncbi:MAG TPA: transposase [Planctomycetes bacterium]|nr:transposase [Planctomycetota bacterium]
MTRARKEIIDEENPGFYHIIVRCVRQAFLCGYDKYSRRNYDHRKIWIRDRLRHLAGIFGIEVFSYAILCNHYHLALRNRPDLVADWSEEEVARRWWRLFPKRRTAGGDAARPSEWELAELMEDFQLMQKARRQLSSISFFMQMQNQFIARASNLEDGCKGRFFEGRFHCTRLEDIPVVAVCMQYIELNPIRAGMAKSIDESAFTSAFERLMGEKARRRIAGYEKKRRKGEKLTKRQKALLKSERRKLRESQWLAPLDAEGSPFVGFEVSEYLAMVEAAGRRVRRGKRGSVPESVPPLLERLELDTARWLEVVEGFGRLFFRVAGKASSMAAAAERAGRRCYHGVRACRRLFGE